MAYAHERGHTPSPGLAHEKPPELKVQIRVLSPARAHTHQLLLASLAENPDDALAAPQLSSEITLCAAEKEEPWQMAMGKDEFVGTWKLVSYEARRSDGQVAYPFGRDVIGVISYDAKGNMSVQVMRSDRPAFAVNDFQKGTPEEIRAAFEGFSAYFGTYDVNEEEGTVTHHLKGSWFPNWIGSDQIRFFEFSGNRLTLRTSSIQVGGVVGTSQLIWERMST